MIIALFIFFWMRMAIERDINYWLPNHIKAKSMWVINFLYVSSRFFAIDVLFLWFINVKFFLYWILLYLFAYAIKRITRNFTYWI